MVETIKHKKEKMFDKRRMYRFQTAPGLSRTAGEREPIRALMRQADITGSAIMIRAFRILQRSPLKMRKMMIPNVRWKKMIRKLSLIAMMLL